MVFSFSFFLSSCSAPHSSSKESQNQISLGNLSVTKTFGNFIDAQAISIDAFGNIYVADAGAPGVYKFNQHGDSIRAVIALGKEHDQFDGPLDIDASLTNSVAVADRNNNRIEIYSKDLIWQASIGGRESGSKIQFGYPLAVRAAPAGNYFIIDGENKRALSIQPESGSQQVISLSGTESASEMNPVSLALSGNEFVTIADASSHSLITFNNAYLPLARVRYDGISNIKLSTSENYLYIFDKNKVKVEVFNASDLHSLGWIGLPKSLNHPVAVFVYKDSFYILTKEKIAQCSKE